VPSAEFTNKQMVEQLLAPLLDASRQISVRLGGPGLSR
jgi:DNA-binding IclR family transcriptional regulator